MAAPTDGVEMGGGGEQGMTAGRTAAVAGGWRRQKLAGVAVLAGCYLFGLLAWQAAALRFEPDLAPTRIVETMWSFYPREEFVGSLLSSLKRITIGYAIAAVLGVLVGTLLGLHRVLREVLDPLWGLLRPIAPLAWVPIAIVWFGVNEEAAIFVIAFTVFFPIMLNTSQGIRDAAAIYREAALTLGARPWNVVWEVSLPAALPSILAGLRVGMGLAWAVIVASELVIGFVLRSGLGYLMIRYTMFEFSLRRVVAVVVVVGVLGLLADQAMTRLADRLTPWRAGLRARS